MNKKDTISMIAEQMAIGELDLLEGKEHKKVGKIYKYAFIVSKYSVSLKPINEGLTANMISNRIQNRMTGKYDVFIVGLKDPMENITDENIASLLGGVLPNLQREVKEFYMELIK